MEAQDISMVSTVSLYGLLISTQFFDVINNTHILFIEKKNR